MNPLSLFEEYCLDGTIGNIKKLYSFINDPLMLDYCDHPNYVPAILDNENKNVVNNKIDNFKRTINLGIPHNNLFIIHCGIYGCNDNNESKFLDFIFHLNSLCNEKRNLIQHCEKLKISDNNSLCEYEEEQVSKEIRIARQKNAKYEILGLINFFTKLGIDATPIINTVYDFLVIKQKYIVPINIANFNSTVSIFVKKYNTIFIEYNVMQVIDNYIYYRILGRNIMELINDERTKRQNLIECFDLAIHSIYKSRDTTVKLCASNVTFANDAIDILNKCDTTNTMFCKSKDMTAGYSCHWFSCPITDLSLLALEGLCEISNYAKKNIPLL